MHLTPEQFIRTLSDPTRLRMVMLLLVHREICVCDLTTALGLPQPKISRHLAILREGGLLLDRRAGQWIHYRMHPDLPGWSLNALRALAEGCANAPPYNEDARRLVSPHQAIGTCD